MPDSTLFLNGRILTNDSAGPHDGPVFAESILVKDGQVAAMGSSAEVSAASVGFSVEVRDLQQKFILPGFIDGHMHLLLGQSLRKLDLKHCTSLDDIRSTIRDYAVTNPDVPTILCRNWFHYMTPEGVTAAMIDDIDPRPIFIDASSQHSCWCNNAALDKLGVADMPDPPGGKIHRDGNGKPSGVLDEGAMMSIIWPYQAMSSPKEERIQAIRAGIAE